MNTIHHFQLFNGLAFQHCYQCPLTFPIPYPTLIWTIFAYDPRNVADFNSDQNQPPQKVTRFLREAIFGRSGTCAKDRVSHQ